MGISPRLLRFLGGAALVAVYFVDHWDLGGVQESPVTWMTSFLSDFPEPLLGSIGILFLSWQVSYLLPSLFGLFAAIQAIRRSGNVQASPRASLLFVRLFPGLWIGVSLLYLVCLRRPPMTDETVVFGGMIGVALAGSVVLLAWRTDRSAEAHLRGGLALGAVLSLVFHASQAVWGFELLIPWTYLLAVSASLLVLVGALLDRPAQSAAGFSSH